MRGAGHRTSVELMWTGVGGVRLIEKYLEERIERKKDQDIQGYWLEIDKPTFCSMYREIKETFAREKY